MLAILLSVVAIVAAVLAGVTLSVIKKVKQLSEEVAASGQQVVGLERELAKQNDENSSLINTISELRSSQNKTEERMAHHEAGVELLWQLELLRSERTWRQSVAIQPDEPSPFISTKEPLRLALEVETTALREDVGAAIDIEILGKNNSQLNQLLTLRYAQELLAIAAFEQQPVVFTVTSEGTGTNLKLVASNGATSLTVEPPDIHSSLLEIETTEGLALTIR